MVHSLRSVCRRRHPNDQADTTHGRAAYSGASSHRIASYRIAWQSEPEPEPTSELAFPRALHAAYESGTSSASINSNSNSNSSRVKSEPHYASEQRGTAHREHTVHYLTIVAHTLDPSRTYQRIHVLNNRNYPNIDQSSRSHLNFARYSPVSRCLVFAYSRLGSDESSFSFSVCFFFRLLRCNGYVIRCFDFRN